MPESLHQVLLALAYYAALVVLMRLLGKRLAGQTTAFDLVVLITLCVVLQQTALLPGPQNALLFVVTVFGAHRGVALLSARSARIRRLVRGAPRPLIYDGRVSFAALKDEGLSYEELLAGLRKLGHSGPEHIQLATLEETGHISAVPLATSGAASATDEPDEARLVQPPVPERLAPGQR